MGYTSSFAGSDIGALSIDGGVALFLGIGAMTIFILMLFLVFYLGRSIYGRNASS